MTQEYKDRPLITVHEVLHEQRQAPGRKTMKNYEARLNLAALALRAVGGNESAKACEEAAEYIRDLLPKPCYCDEHQGTHIRCPAHGSQSDGGVNHE